jgi:hypothetical protein
MICKQGQIKLPAFQKNRRQKAVGTSVCEKRRRRPAPTQSPPHRTPKTQLGVIIIKRKSRKTIWKLFLLCLCDNVKLCPVAEAVVLVSPRALCSVLYQEEDGKIGRERPPERSVRVGVVPGISPEGCAGR